jgi:hypothetical protein
MTKEITNKMPSEGPLGTSESSQSPSRTHSTGPGLYKILVQAPNKNIHDAITYCFFKRYKFMQIIITGEEPLLFITKYHYANSLHDVLVAAHNIHREFDEDYYACPERTIIVRILDSKMPSAIENYVSYITVKLEDYFGIRALNKHVISPGKHEVSFDACEGPQKQIITMQLRGTCDEFVRSRDDIIQDIQNANSESPLSLFSVESGYIVYDDTVVLCENLEQQYLDS